MTAELHALRFAAAEPAGMARFWGDLLGRETSGDGTRSEVLPSEDADLRLGFVSSAEKKRAQNHMHLDLTSASLDDQEEIVQRALELGGRPCDVGQTGEEGHVVLADPEGNELCVIEPGNAFLADTGPIGAVAGDGTRACGLFWAEVLGWPPVWDKDEETAIQSPLGGPKFTWDGPPLMASDGQDRVRFELRVVGPVETELERLRHLGAAVVEGGGASYTLLDPDGHAFSVQAPHG